MATCSRDNTVKYWDTRSNNIVNSIDFQSPIFAADFLGSMAVVSTHDKIQVFQDGKYFKEHAKDTLVKEIVCLSIFPTLDGYAYGTIDGRTHLEDFNDTSKKKTYTFKAHMVKQSGYRSSQPSFFSVNAIGFSDGTGFFTGGGEGSIFYWDRAKQSKLGQLFEQPKNTPIRISNVDISNNRITAGAFHSNKKTMAFATGYDWIEGPNGYKQNFVPHVVVIYDVPEHIKKKERRR